MDAGPALVSILRQGSYLIASINTALDDSQMVRFQQDLIDQIGQHRSRGVIIDVAALDVLDSFGSRTLRNIAEMAPYMHAGQFKSLLEVLEHYNRAAPGPVGHSELKPLKLSQRELAQLEAFLRSLSGGIDAPAELLAPPTLPNVCEGCHPPVVSSQ